jgi:hypothetical protein
MLTGSKARIGRDRSEAARLMIDVRQTGSTPGLAGDNLAATTMVLARGLG